MERCSTMTTTFLGVAPNEAALSASQHPEFFRLPKSRERDPFFGLSRACFYEGEQRGWWKLVRLRQRGRQRGVTLVPFDQVAAFVRKQMEGA